MKQIYIDQNKSFFLDGRRLSAQVMAINAGGKMILDSAGQLGTSGNSKKFNGFADAEIGIELLLFGPQRYNDLTAIDTAFKSLKEGQPQFFSIEAPLLSALKIKKVILKDYTLSEERENSITLSLKFTEDGPRVARIQEQQKTASPPVKKEESDFDSTMMSRTEWQRFNLRSVE